MTEAILLLTCPADWDARRRLEEFGICVCMNARKCGWKSWAGWVNEDVKIRVQDSDPKLLRSMVDALACAANKEKWTIDIAEAWVPATTLPDATIGEIPWGTLIQEKLTRKLLERLPEGSVIVTKPRADGMAFFVRLPRMDERLDVWESARQARAAGRPCRVLWLDDDFDAFDEPSSGERGNEEGGKPPRRW